MRLTPLQQILIYVAADTSLNVSSRVFQIYCTWYFLKVEFKEESLSLVLLTVWITSTVLLPFSGVLADRFKKSWVLLTASLLIMVAASSAIGVANASSLSENHYWLPLELSVVGIIFSVGIALIFPLGTPLIPEIACTETDIHRGIRLKSSMYVVNLLFGPTLAGLVIGRYGGVAALHLSITAAALGLCLSLAFFGVFERIPVVQTIQTDTFHFFRALRDGVRRVLSIEAERAIAIASLCANMLLVPFIFLILPAKILSHGLTMLDLAGVEIAVGVGIFAASSILVHQLQRVLTEHGIPSLGVCVLGASIFAFAYVDNLWLLRLLALALGIGLTTFNVTVNTKRAVSIPAGYRSTMESTLLFFCTITVPVGLWLSKSFLQVCSPNQVIVYGSALFSLAIATVVLSRSLRLMLNAPKALVPYYAQTNGSLF